MISVSDYQRVARYQQYGRQFFLVFYFVQIALDMNIIRREELEAACSQNVLCLLGDRFARAKILGQLPGNRFREDQLKEVRRRGKIVIFGLIQPDISVHSNAYYARFGRIMR
jgi:hypothetical protein